MAKRTQFAGNLDQEIDIYSVVHDNDSRGGQPRSLTLKGSLWADVKINRNSFAGEDQRNYKNTEIVNYTILVRNPLDYKILYTDVVRYKSQFQGDLLLYIKNINAKDQRGFYIEIKARSTSPAKFIFPNQTGLFNQEGVATYNQEGEPTFNQVGV